MAGLGTALNEAALLGVEFDPARRRTVVTFGTPALASGSVRRLQFVLAPTGRIAASLRLGAWNDAGAAVEPFPLDRLAAVVASFGGEPIYGWDFFDVRDDEPVFRDRLSLDWQADERDGRAHTLTLFQEGTDRHLDLRIWFDHAEIRDATGRIVEPDQLIEQGNRFWAGVHAGDPRAAAHGITPVATKPPSPQWTRSDWRLGVLFAVMGVLVTAYGWSAWYHDAPVLLWGGALLFGPLLLLLGGTGIVQSLRAARRRDDRSRP